MSALQDSHHEVIDIRPLGPALAGAKSSTLVRAPTIEVHRLVITRGREIPTHQARGAITVHCLEGRIAFTASGTTHELGPGQMLVLAAEEPHSLVGLEDSSVLVTKVVPVQATAGIERGSRVRKDPLTNAQAGRIIVTEGCCPACDVRTIQVYHQSFPEMRAVGMSAAQAAEQLASRLRVALDFVSDPLHAEAVRAAIDDTRAFLGREGRERRPTDEPGRLSARAGTTLPPGPDGLGLASSPR
jgi:quercetin dioxygenase-like cupin family protein